MKAALLSTRGSNLKIVDQPDPKPGTGEAVVRVQAVPVLSYMKDVLDGTRPYPLLLPIVPGCGPIGIVESVGADATRVGQGQLVFCDPTVRSRDDVVAPDIMLQGLIAPGTGAQRLQAHFRNGAFAERMLAPLENIVPLDGFAQSDCAKLCWLNTLLVPYGGLLAAGLQAGQTVIVNGATGHFGSAAVAVALAMGAERVVAVGRNQATLQRLERELGSRVSPALVTGNEQEDSKAIIESSRKPADCMLDILSPIPTFAPVRAAIMAVRPNGTVVLMGGVQADIVLPYSHVMGNCITIRGQYMYPRQAPLQLIGLLRAGILSLDPFNIRTFALSQVSDALQYAAEHGGAFEMTGLLLT